MGGMVQLKQSSMRNRLLQTLSPDDFALIAPDLEFVALPRSTVLIEPNEPIEHVYFLESGVSSVVSINSESRRVEVCISGSEGLIGPSVVLGVNRTPHQSFMQVEGSGYRIVSAHLARAIESSPSLRHLLLRYIHVVKIQIAATAMSNGDKLQLTHEFLSLMLAVRRAGVTDAIHLLEGTGIIKARRAHITILDRERLEETAGDSYGVPEAEYERLIPSRSSLSLF